MIGKWYKYKCPHCGGDVGVELKVPNHQAREAAIGLGVGIILMILVVYLLNVLAG